MAAALDLHRRHPADKAVLAAKTGPAPAWKTPEAMPTLRNRHARGDVSSYGCIHCHTVREGEVTSRWMAGQGVPDRLLWQNPLPNTLGLGLDPKDGRTVRTVSNASAAQEAGFKPGDAVLRVDGQPVLSVADVQWALHQAPDSGEIRFSIERAGQALDLPLRASDGWRRRLPFHRNNTTSMLQKTIAGFFCEALPGGDRRKRGMADDALALRVTYLPGPKEPEPNLNAVQAGIRVGDVIVEIDGHKGRWTLDEWLAYLFQKKKPGDRLALRVLRGADTVSLDIPLPK